MPKDNIVVVAFGDSLTVGYQSPTITDPWYRETPYCDFLKEKLPTGFEFLVKGISGEMTDEMVRRFERDVLSARPDYTVILGGTNDLGWGVSPEEVLENLKTMYRWALAAHVTPVAVTVPSLRGYDPLIAPRQHLNKGILHLAAELAIPSVDLFTATAEPETFRLGSKYCNDGLHLSTEGYLTLALLLYDHVFQGIDVPSASKE